MKPKTDRSHTQEGWAWEGLQKSKPKSAETQKIYVQSKYQLQQGPGEGAYKLVFGLQLVRYILHDTCVHLAHLSQDIFIFDIRFRLRYTHINI